MRIFTLLLVLSSMSLHAQTRVRENVKQQALITSEEGQVAVSAEVVKAKVKARPKK